MQCKKPRLASVDDMRLRHEPAVLILTRQNLPTLDRSRYASAAGVARGAYVLADAGNGRPDVLLMATGSEVAMCVAAYEELTAEGIAARVIHRPPRARCHWHAHLRRLGPLKELQRRYGFVPENIVAAAKEQAEKARARA